MTRMELDCQKQNAVNGAATDLAASAVQAATTAALF